jgi:hypothetical protein
MSDVPFYERTLDSFADHIITRTRQTRPGHWYACLDTGPTSYASDPDFAAWGATEADAVADCATRIRRDASGIGRYAPRKALSGYELRWRLMKHWVEKETAQNQNKA